MDTSVRKFQSQSRMSGEFNSYWLLHISVILVNSAKVIIIIIIITIIIIIIIPLEFFISVFADGLSVEFEWKQVSSSLQDSSQDSGRSQ